jgi:hypothetical protein
MQTVLLRSAGMWATCFRKNTNHSNDNTTAICEGYHSALKRVLRGIFGEHLRVDRLINHLLTFVAEEFVALSVRSIYGALMS